MKEGAGKIGKLVPKDQGLTWSLEKEFRKVEG